MKKPLIISLLTFILLVVALALFLVNKDSLLGTWQLISYNGQKTSGSITFKANDVLSGEICNLFGATYKVKGKTLYTSDVMGTLIYCKGILGDAELAFHTMNRNGATMQVNNGQLLLTDGKNYFKFSR